MTRKTGRITWDATVKWICYCCYKDYVCGYKEMKRHIKDVGYSFD